MMQLVLTVMLALPFVVAATAVAATVEIRAAGVSPCAQTDYFALGQPLRVDAAGYSAGAQLSVELRLLDATRPLATPTAGTSGAVTATVQLPTDIATPNAAVLQLSGMTPAGGDNQEHWIFIAASLAADADRDGVVDVCDNCPRVANAAQLEADGDLQGDACDVCPLDPEDDADRDGDCANVDNCPLDPNAGQRDGDHDGVGDLCDFCPTVADPRQLDRDRDRLGNRCDCDLDGDGLCGTSDVDLFLSDFQLREGRRSDLDEDGTISIQDFNLLLPWLGAP